MRRFHRHDRRQFPPLVPEDVRRRSAGHWSRRFHSGGAEIGLEEARRRFGRLHLRGDPRFWGELPGNIRYGNTHGIFIDRRGGKEEPVTADRSNNRLQYFDRNGKHLRFVTGGMNLPCHFSFHKDLMLIPDLGARVLVLDKNNEVVADLGDDSKSGWRKTRLMERSPFADGKFVCPHGGCFDHKGNIFVSEWVEVGRLSKLRKV